jgi:hypothetical protein
MTVKELRDLLSGYPDDVTVFINDGRARPLESPNGVIEGIFYDYVNGMLYIETIS